jgi:hypothetical protein
MVGMALMSIPVSRRRRKGRGGMYPPRRCRYFADEVVAA